MIFSASIGAPRPTLVETSKPLTVAEKMAVQWWRPKIDLAELAKLAKDDDWPLERLAAHYGRSPITIAQYLRKMGIQMS